MTLLDFVALVILALLVGLIVFLVVFLGELPGRIARQRDHPNTDSIRIAGWATLFLAGVGWPFVLMWAHTTPGHKGARTDDSGDAVLREEVRQLREQLAVLQDRLKTKGGDR